MSSARALREAWAERDTLWEALAELYSLQNGPPLPSYAQAWAEAMGKASAVLAAKEEPHE